MKKTVSYEAREDQWRVRSIDKVQHNRFAMMLMPILDAASVAAVSV